MSGAAISAGAAAGGGAGAGGFCFYTGGPDGSVRAWPFPETLASDLEQVPSDELARTAKPAVVPASSARIVRAPKESLVVVGGGANAKAKSKAWEGECVQCMRVAMVNASAAGISAAAAAAEEGKGVNEEASEEDGMEVDGEEKKRDDDGPLAPVLIVSSANGRTSVM